ncbi:MAG: immunoglobulin domain-containing protein, partial [Pseudomonadales bacterium]
MPVITQHPLDQTVFEGQTGTFGVAAVGAPPLFYQWQQDGVDIAGAWSSSYTTPATSLSDDGATFRCVVTNLNGGATSTAATLTVNPVSANAPVISSFT